MILEPDKDLDNRDWVKQSFDLDIHDIKDLRMMADVRGITVSELLNLPAFKLAKDLPTWLMDIIADSGTMAKWESNPARKA